MNKLLLLLPSGVRLYFRLSIVFVPHESHHSRQKQYSRSEQYASEAPRQECLPLQGWDRHPYRLNTTVCTL